MKNHLSPPGRKLSHSSQSRTPKLRWGLFTVFGLTLFLAACASKMKVPVQYSEFVTQRKQAVSLLVMEVYGSYSATSSRKTVRASYNLLIDSGKSGYLEILDPSKQLVNSVSLTPETLTVLWAKEGTYVQEPSTPENLNAITGLPLLTDDLLLMLSGTGLNFSEWQETGTQKDGWDLKRGNFSAHLSLEENISRMQIQPPSGKPLMISYDDYKVIDNRLLPHKIKFETPNRTQVLELRPDKYVFRDEPATAELFSVQIPPDARKVSLKELYRGKPLLLDTAPQR